MKRGSKYTQIAELLDKRCYSAARNKLLRISDNRDNQWYYYIAIANYGLGDYDTALELAQKARSMNPKVEYEELIIAIQSKIDNREGKLDMIGPPIPKPKFNLFKSVFSAIYGFIDGFIYDFGVALLVIVGVIILFLIFFNH